MQRRTRKVKIPVVAREAKKKKPPVLFVAAIVAGVAAVAVLGYLFFSGFEGNKTAARITDPGQTQGDMMVELSPAEPTRDAVVRLTVKGFDPSSAQYEWTIDGTPVTVSDPMLLTIASDPMVKKGAVIRAKAMVAGKEIVSNEVRIVNSPVQLNGVGFADQIRPSDPLTVKIEAIDVDQDEIRYTYAWTVNGAEAGSADRLERKIRRGDRIVVQVTACDSEDGCSSRSAERIINNMPPEIAENKEYRFVNDVFEYQVRASDSDEDPLVYALDSAPAGMSIDPNTGFIRWQVPPQISGKQSISVVVTDGQGGRSTYQLIFTL